VQNVSTLKLFSDRPSCTETEVNYRKVFHYWPCCAWYGELTRAVFLNEIRSLDMENIRVPSIADTRCVKCKVLDNALKLRLKEEGTLHRNTINPLYVFPVSAEHVLRINRSNTML
jgi:hypothetical protein